jgi:5-methylcytosine-specific restriction endonuclease McrA
MTELKRDLIKYIRDRAKSRYKKDNSCFICGSSDNLDFHHFNSLTELLNAWLGKNKFNPASADEIMSIRDEFIEQHSRELYDEALTLCHLHHLKLHSIYGKNPPLATAKKQVRWVQIQRDKYAGRSD